MLDTGAKPSVIDRKTVDELVLKESIQPTRSHVFGLGQAPVPVLGKVVNEVKLGPAAATAHFYVLDSDEPTLLLGREFMVGSDSVTFDFTNGHIGLGKVRVPIESALTGGSPLFRAQTAIRDSTVATLAAGSDHIDIFPELKAHEHEELARLLEDNTDIFAVDPKKPGWTSMCKHSIDTGDASPIKERTRRILAIGPDAR